MVAVTGAARGIGKAVALAWATRGAKLLLVGRSSRQHPSRAMPGTLEETAAEVESRGGRADVVRADLGNPDDLGRLAERLQADRCDVLVNNAAVSFVGDFLDVPVRRFATVINVDLVAPVWLTRAVLPQMIERGSGAIVNLSSVAAVEDVVPQLPYACSKLALERFSAGLHRQIEGTGVAVHCIRIDELVPTEALTRSLGDGGLPGMATCSAEDLASAIVELCGRPDLSGQVLTHGMLRSLGILAPAAVP
jgi:3-oxoacyl-[acyl-carrier protein] reductase